MNRRTLFGRFSALQSANRTADRQNYFRPALEPLEDRKMLAVDVMLSHNWIDLTSVGANLAIGDSVQDSVTGVVAVYGFDPGGGTPGGFGDVTNAEDPASPTHHYLVGSENIHDAVLGTPDNGALQISDGTYAASDVLLGGPGHNHPITVYGDGALTKIVPEVASNHSDTSNLGIAGNGASGAHMAFIINAQNTTVSNLTIDGNLGGVGGSMNYQQGVATFYDATQDGNTGASAQAYTDLSIGSTVQPYTDLKIGTQHSYSDLKIGNDQSYTDLAIGNHRVFTDIQIDANDPTRIYVGTAGSGPQATTGFQPGDAGSLLTITSGAGFTLQTVHIVSVSTTLNVLTNKYQAVIAPSIGPVGLTGGHGFSDGGNKEVTSALNPFNAASVGSTLKITSSSTVQNYTDLVIGNDHSFTDLTIGNQHTYTDLVVDAQTNTNVTSGAVPFAAGDVGSTLTITGGTGFFPGAYTISSVAGGVATLNSPVGLLSSSGGTGSADGGNRELTSALSPFSPGDVGGILTITGGPGFTPATYTLSVVKGNVAVVSAVGGAGTDGSTGGTATYGNVKQLKSAAHPFDTSQIGATLTITAGGGFTGGTYTIQSVNGSAASVNASLGTDGSASGSGSEQGFTVQSVLINSVTGVVATVGTALGLNDSTGGVGNSFNVKEVTSTALPFAAGDAGSTLTITDSTHVHTYTADLTIDAVSSSKVTDSGTPFTSGDVGLTLNITGGTNFTVGSYKITGVAAGVATVVGSLGTTGSTGGSGTATGFFPSTYTISTVNNGVALLSVSPGVDGSTGGTGTADGGTSKVSSALHPFTSADVNRTLVVTGGTGFTVQNVNINSVVGGIATVSASLGTNGSTGGTGSTNDGPTRVTSALHPFQTNQIGLTLSVTGGTGFTVQSVTITNVVGNVATVSASLGTLLSTNGTGNIAAQFYAGYDWLDAELGNPVTQIEIPLDPAPFGPGNPTVNIYVSNLTVNNTWVHGIALAAFYQTATYKNMGISGNKVNNVGSTAARASDPNNVGILMMNMDNGDIGIDVDQGDFPAGDPGFGNTVTGAGIGIMTTYYGSTPTFGNVGGPSTHATIAGNTVTDAVQRAYSVTLNHGDNSFGIFNSNKATFSDPNNTAVGIYWDHSETFITDDTITGAHTGIQIVNTTFDIQGSTGRPVNPLIYGGTLITGPTGSHPTAVGIDLRNTAGEPAQTAALIGEATITGYPVGVAISQAVADGGVGVVPGKTYTDLAIDASNNKIVTSLAQPFIVAKSYTDLVIDGTFNTKVTSAAQPFSASDVGTTLSITGGIGFTRGSYIVESVAGNVATLSSAVGTVGSTGGIGSSTGDVGTILNITGGTGFTVQSVRIASVDPSTHKATVTDVNGNSGVPGFPGLGTLGSTGGAGNISHASILFINGAHMSGNTVGISAGDNSQVFGGGAFTADPITTSGTALINPSWVPGIALGDNTMSIGDEGLGTVAVPATADILNSGNLTLSSSGTFAPLVTGQSGSPVTLFNFNSVPLGADDVAVPGGIYPDQAADLPLAIPYNSNDHSGSPNTAGPPYETDTWGGTFLGTWHADMVQNGSGQLVIGGTATDGNGSSFAFGTIGHKDPFNVGYNQVGNAPLRILDAVDLSNYTTIQVVVKPRSDNLSPVFAVGLIDARGNANAWAFNTPSSTSTFTTLTLNLLSPSANLIGPDNSIDLKHIAGFVIGGDNGTLTGQTDTPFRFSFDNIGATTIANSQISVHSTIALGGTLAPTLAAGFVPGVGQSFTIIKNNSVSGLSGSFSNVANGGTIIVSGLRFQVTYTATTDVVMTRLAEAPPVVDPNGSDAGTYTNTWSAIGSPVSVVGSTNDSHGATITDADDTNLASFTVSIASPAAHDVLNATGQGNVTVSGNGTSTLTFTPTSGTATLADFQATLRTATYNNTNGDKGAGPKTINFTATDATGGGTATASSQIVISEQPVVVDPNGSDAGTYTNTWSNAGGVSVVGSTNDSHGATITDVDDTNLASLTVSIASPAAHDVLNATGQGNVTVTGNGTATLTFAPTSGSATLADFQATLRTATYNNTTGDEGAGPKTINFTAHDFTGGGTATASSQIVISNTASTVAGRFTFYAFSSRYDQTGGTNGRPPGTFSDDNAIATDKSAYVPTPGVTNASATPATFSNMTSYDQGINGIMVDLSTPGGSHASITQANITNDFTFRIGNNNSPTSWATNTNLPNTVTVRSGAGTGGSDRVELIWGAPNGITQKWLEVIVKATGNTGLAASDTFFFGNEIGDANASNTVSAATVTSADTTAAQTHGAALKANIPVTNIYDFTKDGQVTSPDTTDAQTHGTSAKTGLQFLKLGALSGPFAPAPDGSGGDAALDSALSSTSASSASPTTGSASTPALPSWVVDRLRQLDLNSGPIATILDHLAEEDSLESRRILVKADHIADALNLDDALLDSILVRLGVPDSDA